MKGVMLIFLFSGMICQVTSWFVESSFAVPLLNGTILFYIIYYNFKPKE